MNPHVKTYLDYYGYGEQDIILCERCNKKATDIHHIIYKSQGGKDTIENLIALCRDCHNLAHNEKITKEELYKIHNKNL